jgi:hypothetical protein
MAFQKGIFPGFERRENQAAAFPRGRSEADHSRTRVLLGSSAERPHRKARGLFSRKNPLKTRENALQATGLPPQAAFGVFGRATGGAPGRIRPAVMNRGMLRVG